MSIAIRGYGQSQKIPSFGYGGIVGGGDGGDLIHLPVREIKRVQLINIFASVKKQLDFELKISVDVRKQTELDLDVFTEVKKEELITRIITASVGKANESMIVLQSDLDHENLIDIIEKI